MYQVVNAGCADKDIKHLRELLDEFNLNNDSNVEMRVHWSEERALLALQGPKAAGVLKGLIDSSIDLDKVAFGQSFWTSLGGIANCFVSRCGYTGEDGFELFIPKDAALTPFLQEKLLGDPAVRLAGLGVRDALRLEAGLCLYGHDIDETTTPVEASIAWTIAKGRRELLWQIFFLCFFGSAPSGLAT